MKLTLATARPYIAKAAGLCVSDARVIDYANRAVQRLLPRGLWVGTVARYRICINADCITWPRQIETIEAFAIDGRPHKIRNGWHEFLESGQGVLGRNSNNGSQLVDRGDGFCAFDDITNGATNAQIRIYTDLPEASGKYITLLGYDENSNWIRSLDGTEYIDGIKVAIQTNPATITTTTQKFSRLTGVIKPKTNGNVRLYEFNGTSNVRALAVYEPDEELPSYRRSFVPGLRNVHQSSECEKASVEVAAKLRFVSVSKENDFLLIGNIQALEMETRAIRAWENEIGEKAFAFEGRAIKFLNDELASHHGDGAVVQVRFERDVGCADVEPLTAGYGYW